MASPAKPPEVIATIWVRWNEKRQKWDYSRTRGATVKTAPDKLSALVSFDNPGNRGFLPIITPVGKAQGSLYLSATGTNRNHSFQVSSIGNLPGTGGGKGRPNSFMAIVVAI